MYTMDVYVHVRVCARMYRYVYNMDVYGVQCMKTLAA
jgi:hypothetical protein